MGQSDTNILPWVLAFITLVGAGGPLAFWLNWQFQQRKARLDEAQIEWDRKQKDEQARLDREKAALERRRADIDADAMLTNNAEMFRQMIGKLQREMVDNAEAARLEAQATRQEAQAAREASERSERAADLARRESHRTKQIALLLNDQMSEVKQALQDASDNLSSAIVIIVSINGDLADGSKERLEDAAIKMREVYKILDNVRSLPPVVIDGDPPQTGQKPQTAPLDPNAPIRGPGSAKGIPRRSININKGDEQ